MTVDLGSLGRRIVETAALLREWQELTGASDDDRKRVYSDLMRRARAGEATMPTLARELVERAKK